jgi:hypothetical protein
MFSLEQKFAALSPGLDDNNAERINVVLIHSIIIHPSINFGP